MSKTATIPVTGVKRKRAAVSDETNVEQTAKKQKKEVATTTPVTIKPKQVKEKRQVLAKVPQPFSVILREEEYSLSQDNTSGDSDISEHESGLHEDEPVTSNLKS